MPFSFIYTPGNKKSWQRRNDVSLYVPTTSQVRLEWNTQWRLTGRSPRPLSGTSPRRLIRMPWRCIKGTLWRRPISTSLWRLKQVSSETHNNVSVVRHQGLSVIRIHEVSLVRLYNVSWNSQIKYPITSLWYVSTTPQSYVVATPCLYYRLYYVFKLLCHDLHLVGFNVSFKYQIKHQSFLVPTRRETKEVVWVIYKLIELLLHLKMASYINNICNVSCLDI